MSRCTLLLLLAALTACAAPRSPGDDAALEYHLARLDSLEHAALDDPALQRMDAELGEALMIAMLEEDPGLAAVAAGLPRLEARLAGAREYGNTEETAALRRELEAAEKRYLSARRAALRQPSLARRIGAFDSLIRDRILEIDPGAAASFTAVRRLAERR